MVQILKHTENELVAETKTLRVVLTEGGLGVIPLEPPITLPPPTPPKEDDIDLLFPYKPYVGRSRISFNIDAQAAGNTVPAFINLCRELQPTTVLVLNDAPKYELCRQIHAVSPSTIIVHRMYLAKDEHSGWEGEFWRIETGKIINGAREVVAARNLVDHISANAPAWVVHNLGNEPDPDPTGEDFKAMTDFLIEAMDYATSINRKLCVWNVQSVTIDWDVLQTGVYDKLLKRLSVNDHYAGFHEYTFAMLQLDSSGLQWNILESNEPIKTDWWALPDRFQTKVLQHSHLGRCRLVDGRLRQLGEQYAMPLKILTEFGWDKVLEQNHPTVVRINDEARSLGFQRALGAPTLVKTWERLYNQFNWQQFEAQQLIWADGVYDEFVIGFDVFGWNYLGEWLPFNVAEQIGMHVYITEYAKRRPLDNTSRQKVRIKATNGLNIRMFPSTAAAAIGQIPYNSVAYSLDIQYIEKSTNNVWILVSYNGLMGWCASWLMDEI